MTEKDSTRGQNKSSPNQPELTEQPNSPKLELERDIFMADDRGQEVPRPDETKPRDYSGSRGEAISDEIERAKKAWRDIMKAKGYP